MSAQMTSPRPPQVAAIAPVEVQQIPLGKIRLNRPNPRQSLGDVGELAASIQAHGLLQPVVVRRAGRAFELVAGHRRLEAMRLLGWPSVPAMVHAASEDEAEVLTLVENLQRSDLTPAEEASALEALMRHRGWTTRQVASAIHRSQAYVSKRLRVFEDSLLAPAVLAEQLSISAAEELLTLDEARRYELLSLAIEQRWDRQRVRREARERFAANLPSGARPSGLTRRIHQFRLELREVDADQFNEADKRELRLLLDELASFGHAPAPGVVQRRRGPLMPHS